MFKRDIYYDPVYETLKITKISLGLSFILPMGSYRPCLGYVATGHIR